MPFSSYAIYVDGNGCMPTLNDPPYPFNCLPTGLASTFERYQNIARIHRIEEIFLGKRGQIFPLDN